jgi:thiosulfate dehydrogenase [quinone] large subunit
MRTIWLTGAEWTAVLRIGLGLWWLESWRHKDRKGWLERGTGITWAAGVAARHRWQAVRTGFDKVVAPRPKAMAYVVVHAELAPRPKAMAYVVVHAELALGLGLISGFLTPVALVGGLLLNLLYLVLMIHDWAEQGQNAMMALISLVSLFAMSWQVWSLDHAIGLF